MSMTPYFARKLRRAKKNFLRELRDGCNDCQAVPHRGFCKAHRDIGIKVYTRPRSVPEFQEYLSKCKR